MRHSQTPRKLIFGLFISLSLAATANSADGGQNLSEASLTVGSKGFTEQLILGQMAIKLLEDAGVAVTDRVGLAGTQNIRRALLADEIDMYWEYTGTGWVVHLKHTPGDSPGSSEELYERVAKEDLKKNNIKWLPPADLNNTYSVATTESRAEEMGINTLSDYAELAKKSPQKASLCAATDFITRDDGLPGLEQTYNFELPDSAIAQVTEGVVYPSVKRGKECKFGEVLATDGRIAANNFVVLGDDKNFFVKYNVALTMRQETIKTFPELAELLKPLTNMLTNETMRKLNAKVDVQGIFPEQVAENFLKERGFID